MIFIITKTDARMLTEEDFDQAANAIQHLNQSAPRYAHETEGHSSTNNMWGVR